MAMDAAHPQHLPGQPGGRPGRRLAWWLLAAFFACFAAYVARLHEITHDVFHEMSLAREMLQAGLPLSDSYAFTPTIAPVVHHEWGTGLALYTATMASGLGVWGLSLLRWGLIALLWVVLYRVARMRGAAPELFALCSLLVFPLMWVGFATLRAQLLTLVCLAIQLWMQQLDWRGRRLWVLAWPALLVAWLNLHAGFVVGIGLMALHILERIATALRATRSATGAGQATWHLAFLPPLAVAALYCNPYGWSYLPYLQRALAMPRPTIAEWQPLWRTHAAGWTLFCFALSLGLAVSAGWRQRRARGIGGFGLLLAAVMALRHIRHGSIFAVLWIAYVPAWATRTAAGTKFLRWLRQREAVAIPWAQLAMAASLAFALLHQCWRPTLPGVPQYSSICFPTEAVEYLRRAKFRGNLWTPFHAGAYVSWVLHPAVKVSLDGRYEVAFAPGVLEEHTHFFSGRDRWWELLDRYPIDAILIPHEAPVRESLGLIELDADPKADGGYGLTPVRSTVEAGKPRTASRWRRVYEDGSFVILAREELNMPVVLRPALQPVDAAVPAFAASLKSIPE